MSDYDIPIIEPTIDCTKVPAINQKRTVTFINHFIIQTVTFLNSFALSCEEKLFQFENKLQKVEASLKILESRFASIPGLEESASPLTVSDPIENEEPKREKTTVVDEVDESVEKDSDEPESKSEENEMQPISRDPLYEKYFKMLHVGVLKPAVKLQMQQDGLDPSVLDNPDRLVAKGKSSAADQQDCG